MLFADLTTPKNKQNERFTEQLNSFYAGTINKIILVFILTVHSINILEYSIHVSMFYF